MSSILILGAGGHAKVCVEVIQQTSNYVNIDFLDDSYLQHGEHTFFTNYRIIGPLAAFFDENLICRYQHSFVALGDNILRNKCQNDLVQAGYTIPSFAHPSSSISPSAQIGKGTIIMANTVIQASACIGDGCIINTSSSIDHDANIADFVHVAPGANLAGSVSVGINTFVGLGSLILQNRSIGSDVIIGAGSVVTHNIVDGSVVYGVPARYQSKRSSLSK